MGINESASREYILIGAGDHVTSEVRLVPAADPGADPVVVAPRRANHEYSIDHQGDRFIIRTNDTHKNTRLATAPGNNPTEAAWQPLVDASDEHYITGFDTFQDFIAVEVRIDGLDHVRLMWRDGSEKSVDFPEEAYSASVGQNREFQTDTLRLSYASMVTPSTVFDYHIDTEELEVRQVQEVPSGYDSSEYVTERLLAPARDGVEVPVSVVRHRDTPVDGTAPLYLYGYGAYGYAIPPASPPPACPCWTGVSSSPSPTFGAATTWATTGTRRASWTAAPTPSTTSWTWPATWWPRVTCGKAASPSPGAAPAAS